MELLKLGCKDDSVLIPLVMEDAQMFQLHRYKCGCIEVQDK